MEPSEQSTTPTVTSEAAAENISVKSSDLSSTPETIFPATTSSENIHLSVGLKKSSPPSRQPLLPKSKSRAPAVVNNPKGNLLAGVQTGNQPPGTFLNFTISNGELKPNAATVKDRTKDPITTTTTSTVPAKPIIVTVSGLPSTNVTTAPAVNSPPQTDGAKTADESAPVQKLRTTTTATLLSALSGAIPISGTTSNPGSIPIVLATAPNLVRAKKSSPTGFVQLTPVSSTKIPGTGSLATFLPSLRGSGKTSIARFSKPPGTGVAVPTQILTVPKPTSMLIAVTTKPQAVPTDRLVPADSNVSTTTTSSSTTATSTATSITEVSTVTTKTSTTIDSSTTTVDSTSVSNNVSPAVGQTAVSKPIGLAKSETKTSEIATDKKDPDSLDFDPISAMDWNGDIGTLPGSDLKFKLNEFGTLEILSNQEDPKSVPGQEDPKSVPGQEDPKSAPGQDDPKSAPEQEDPKSDGGANTDTQQEPSTTDMSAANSRKRKLGRPLLPKEVEPKSSNVLTKRDVDNIDAIQCCENCSTYGLSEEFYLDTTFCCKECYMTFTKKKEFKRKRIELMERKKMKLMASTAPQPPSPATCSNESVRIMEEEAMSKVNKPGTYPTKKFFWTTYLEENNAFAAPSNLFMEQSQNFPILKNQFKVGMKLEGIDPKHPALFCVLTVVEVVGFRIRLHFDGYLDTHDFWVNADSAEIFCAGWCERNGHKLQPPKGYSAKSFNWQNYLKQTKSIAAPKGIFLTKPQDNQGGINANVQHGFRIGAKLEAVDKKNSSLVCVATVADILRNRFLVHFDGWDDMYDYWAANNSPYIHPINWCSEMGHVLTPPNNYKAPASFDWDEYLNETKSVAVPSKYFRQRSTNGFKIGMKLEAVDKRNAMLIRVATVSDVQPHSIKVHFDGWSDAYDYWVDDDSPDVHPPCWAYNAGYPLQPPPSFSCKKIPAMSDMSSDQPGCPTPGCTGIGHIKGPKFTSHHTLFGCPYSTANLNKESTLGDRFGAAKQGETVFIEPLVKKSEAAAANVAMDTNTKQGAEPRNRFRRCPTPGCNGIGHITGKFTVHHRVSGCPLANSQKNLTQQEKMNALNGDNSVSSNSSTTTPSPPPPVGKNEKPGSRKRGRKKRGDADVSPSAKSKQSSAGVKKTDVKSLQNSIHGSVFTTLELFSPPSKDELPISWTQHLAILPEIRNIKNVRRWTPNDVGSFVAGLTSCPKIGKSFKDEQIDGESFLLLNQDDVVKLLKVKLGPALKIYNSIMLLRKTIGE